jgi:hypothetical protein
VIGMDIRRIFGEVCSGKMTKIAADGPDRDDTIWAGGILNVRYARTMRAFLTIRHNGSESSRCYLGYFGRSTCLRARDTSVASAGNCTQMHMAASLTEVDQRAIPSTTNRLHRRQQVPTLTVAVSGDDERPPRF